LKRNPVLRCALLLAIGLSAVGSPGGAGASPRGPGDSTEIEIATAREILSRLDERLRGIRSMRGRFVQTFVSAGLGIPQAEEGRFVVERPDKLRWDYVKPERKTAISDGEHTWLHLPEEKLVYRGSVEAWRRTGAFAILVGGSLADEYEAGGLEADSASRRGDLLLRLTPRRPREEVQEILVEIEPEGLDIVAVTAVDALGNRTGVRLSEVEENVRIRSDLFVFTPPRGTRIVDRFEEEAEPR
jgi:outer membrane lipoprotein carrier protein